MKTKMAPQTEPTPTLEGDIIKQWLERYPLKSRLERCTISIDVTLPMKEWMHVWSCALVKGCSLDDAVA